MSDHPFTYRWIGGNQILNGRVIDNGKCIGSGNFAAAPGEQLADVEFTPTDAGFDATTAYNALQRGDAEAIPTDPTPEYKYIAIEAIRIEQTNIPAGTEIGRGASPKALRDNTGSPRWVHFEAAEGFEGLVGAGHVVARMTTGTVTAERIEQ